ncbi:putative uncharacterized protein DDB_G0277255 isoform X2 [Chrysoperla carnea]|uniref:putative uncharacterized protein DDB_G0277255 isoform X2 n=1 Tax=Chrysoperla carnea TaxID=189513 RepID=UPI001D063833|nr:putative uncharacterized protein DDB_G0277255 isoform X2 [Chrysoperla carnea]
MTMASNHHNVLEESRPPEPSTSTPPPESINTQCEEVPILENLKSMATTQSCRQSLNEPKIETKRPNSLQETIRPEDRSNRVTSWRRSYHKDVEEALSSLLWEPYDCRDDPPSSTQRTPPIVIDDYWNIIPNASSDVSSLSSSSSVSSSGGGNSSLYDICVLPDNSRSIQTIAQSFTDEFSTYNHRGYRGYSDPTLEYPYQLPTSFTDDFNDILFLKNNNEDPNLCYNNGSTMVNHTNTTLVVTKPVIEVGASAHQSLHLIQSRGTQQSVVEEKCMHNSVDISSACTSFKVECIEEGSATRTSDTVSLQCSSCYENNQINNNNRHYRSSSCSEIRTLSNVYGSDNINKMRLSVPPCSSSSSIVPLTESTTTTTSSVTTVVLTTPVTSEQKNVLLGSGGRSSLGLLRTNQIPVVHGRSNSAILYQGDIPGQHVRNTSGVSLNSSSGSRINSLARPSASNHRVQVTTNGANLVTTRSSNNNLVQVNNGIPYTQNIIHTRVPSLPSTVPKSANNNNVNNNTVNVVNCYRAVPVQVVSNVVPTIQCLNSAESSNNRISNSNNISNNNVSNVQIVQTVQAVATPVSSTSVSTTNNNNERSGAPGGGGIVLPQNKTRTFTSTEAQTDDTSVGTMLVETTSNSQPTPSVMPVNNINREQRRRERRERRHQHRIHNSNHQHLNNNVQNQWTSTPNTPGGGDLIQQQQSTNDQQQRLPDILNSHLPPPYSTLPLGVSVQPPPPVPTQNPPAVPMPVVAPPMLQGSLAPVPFNPAAAGPFTQMPLVQGAPTAVTVPMVPVPSPSGGLRFLQFQNPVGMRRSRRSGQTYTSEDQPKSCCGVLLTQTVSIRWFIVMIAFVGVCCAIVGTILGAMKASGREHLTVSLLMIGVGIILITVSGIAWRLTSHDAPTCRAMLGLGGSDDGTAGDSCTRRFVPRLPPSYGRPHHPYAAMMYPEFQYRPPPPSYQASMQEYRLRLLLLDRHAPVLSPNGVQHTVTPPPTYRSHSGTPITNRRDQSQSEYSCPPSYRSRSSSSRPVLDPNGTNGSIAADHSREHSLSLSESNGSVVNVVSILTNQVGEERSIENISIDNVKLVPETEIAPLRMLLKSDNLDTTKDGNLVTIVQTSSDQSPVIVTVSGSQMATNLNGNHSNEINTEMEILAHL